MLNERQLQQVVLLTIRKDIHSGGIQYGGGTRDGLN